MKDSMPSQVPADIYSLKKIGLKSWLENFYWPVSDEHFFRMLDMLWKAFDHLYERLERNGRDLVLADTGFIGHLAQCLHAFAVKAECTKRGIKIVVEAQAEGFYEEHSPALAQAYRLLLNQIQNPWVFKFRSTVKEVRFNDHLPLTKRVAGFLRDKDHWGLGSHSRLKSDYLKKHPLYLAHPYWQSLVSGVSWKQGDALPEDLRENLGRFFRDVSRDLSGYFGLRPDLSEFPLIWLERLQDLNVIYQHVRRIRRPPKTVLLTEVAHPMHKVIALALKQEGTEVIGFHHGNDMGNAESGIFGYVQACHLNRYACPTEKAADLHARKYGLCGIHHLHAIDFVSVDTSWYQGLLNSFSKRPVSAKIQKVMVVGYPMNAVRYLYSSGDFFLFQVDLELRMMRLFKENGFIVLYKVHPERRKEAEGIYEGACDQILGEPFEEVWPQADAIVYPNTTSSTFGYALTTNRPLIALDLQGKRWNREPYDLLKKRCTMVPAWFTERNRVDFDEKSLVEALQRKPETPDYAYVRELMVP